MSRSRVFLTGYVVTFPVVFRSEAMCLCRIIMVLCCFIVCFFRHYCSPLWSGRILTQFRPSHRIEQFDIHGFEDAGGRRLPCPSGTPESGEAPKCGLRVAGPGRKLGFCVEKVPEKYRIRTGSARKRLVSGDLKPHQYRERSAKPRRTYREPEVSGSEGGCGLLVNPCHVLQPPGRATPGPQNLGGLARRQFPAESCRSVAGLGFHSEQPARPDRVQRACRQSTADNRTGVYPPARLGCACGSWRPACVHQSLRAPNGSSPS